MILESFFECKAALVYSFKLLDCFVPGPTDEEMSPNDLEREIATTEETVQAALLS